MAITCFFAPPGSGKSCVLSLICQKENKKIEKGKSKYKYVFTNFGCVGAYKISLKDFERYYIHDSLILLDEVTMEADSRDWKRISKEFINFVVTHRHLNNDIICAVQDFTILLGLKKLLEKTVINYFSLSGLPYLSSTDGQDVNKSSESCLLMNFHRNLLLDIDSLLGLIEHSENLCTEDFICQKLTDCSTASIHMDSIRDLNRN